MLWGAADDESRRSDTGRGHWRSPLVYGELPQPKPA